jgi:hypothetical protein
MDTRTGFMIFYVIGAALLLVGSIITLIDKRDRRKQ